MAIRRGPPTSEQVATQHRSTPRGAAEPAGAVCHSKHRALSPGRSLTGQSARLWRAEDVVRTDPAPYDVHLAGLHAGSELPGGPAVRGERHLHDLACALNGLYPETGPERPSRFQILDEPSHRCTKPLLLG